jgi:hypothetical protein
MLRLFDHEVVPEPEDFGLNKKGMQAGEALPEHEALQAYGVWHKAREEAIAAATKLVALGVHKQWVNRLLEPFSTIVSLFTGTGEVWDHFFKLRDHPAAEPSFQKLARMMKEKLKASEPAWVNLHLPFITQEERDADALSTSILMRLSAARCARVSYLTHDGKRDLKADYNLFKTLAYSDPPHMSPLEHTAMSGQRDKKYANFTGWCSLRCAHELGTMAPNEARAEASLNDYLEARK